jgi:hypothetical protein
MDPHKRSATIEVMASDETVVGSGRFDTGRDGYAAMRKYAKQWPNRVWAIEGCQGTGRHIANRLLTDGEQVVDVPPKLSARARVFATGQGRKTDATDAHSVALVGTRMAGLRPVVNDEQLALLRILVDRRRSESDPRPRTDRFPHASAPTCTLRMEENFYVLQGVGGGTADVWNRSGSVQRGDYSAFVQPTIDPRQMSQTRCGKGADLAVVVLEQLEMQFLQLFPVSVAV